MKRANNNTIHLTKEQANALFHANRATKIDCWFYLIDNQDGTYAIYDCENDRTISLGDALYDAVEAYQTRENLEELGMTDEEIEIIEDLLNDYGIVGY